MRAVDFRERTAGVRASPTVPREVASARRPRPAGPPRSFSGSELRRTAHASGCYAQPAVARHRRPLPAAVPRRAPAGATGGSRFRA
jgi:hypothetical protein